MQTQAGGLRIRGQACILFWEQTHLGPRLAAVSLAHTATSVHLRVPRTFQFCGCHKLKAAEELQRRDAARGTYEANFDITKGEGASHFVERLPSLPTRLTGSLLTATKGDHLERHERDS